MSLEMTLAASRLAAVSQDKVTPGVLGFVVVAAIAVATWLLIRSMNKHMRRVAFDPAADDPAADDPAVDDPAVDGAAVAVSAVGDPAAVGEPAGGTERQVEGGADARGV